MAKALFSGFNVNFILFFPFDYKIFEKIFEDIVRCITFVVKVMNLKVAFVSMIEANNLSNRSRKDFMSWANFSFHFRLLGDTAADKVVSSGTKYFFGFFAYDRLGLLIFLLISHH